MINFTSLGGRTLLCACGTLSLIVFPEGKGKTDAGKGKDAMTLLSSPEETPTDGIISWPGEYHEKGVAIRGIGHIEGQQVSYIIQMEGSRIAFFSSPLQKLTDHELELVGDVDILVLPTEQPAIVQNLIDETDPRLLILVPGEGKDAKARDEVLRLCGAAGKEAVTEFKTKGALSAEGRDVVVMGK